MTLSKHWFDNEGGLMSAQYLRKLQFDIAAVIDVGVCRGTPWLYEAYPKLPYILVDPLPGCEAMMTSHPRNYTFVAKGAGAVPARLELVGAGAKSTLQERTVDLPGRRERHEVDITTMDNIIDEHCPSGRLGVKIDIEGAEIPAIEGLRRHASRVEFIICEVSVRAQYKDGYDFSTFISFMANRGFRFYNFISPQKLHPTHHDCLFLPAGHPLFEWRPSSAG